MIPTRASGPFPDNTKIAAQGKLLLGFDVFDGFRGFDNLDPVTSEPYQGALVGNNGMGLAASNVEPGLEYVTVPPIYWEPIVVPPYDIYADITGSVFKRDVDLLAVPPPLPFDFIDNDGDGLSSAVHILTDANYNLDMDLDNVLEEYQHPW